jgi:hypothetical protein
MNIGSIGSSSSAENVSSEIQAKVLNNIKDQEAKVVSTIMSSIDTGAPSAPGLGAKLNIKA